MPRGTSKPYPWDVILNGRGYMLGRDQAGNVLWKRTNQMSADAADQPATRGRQHRGFSGGVGHKRRRGTDDDDGLNTTSTVTEPGGIDCSYGPPILSPKVTSNTVDAGQTIRDIVGFGGAGYAAVGTKVYKSAGGLFAADGSSVYTAQSQITDLEVFQGTNGIYSIVLAQQFGPIVWSIDGTTWVVDGDTTGRVTTAKGFFKTANAGSSFTDYTANVGDTSTASVATLSSLDTFANGDYFLIGSDVPFYAAILTIGNSNSTVSTLTAEYFDGSAWQSLAITDGTKTGSTTLAVTGTISWTRPASVWAKTRVTNSGQQVAQYFVRFRVSVQIDSSVTVQTVSLRYNAEADRLAIAGNALAKLDGNLIMFNTAGGPDGTWFNNADPIGDDSMTAQGLGSAGGAAFAKLDKAFGANDQDGGKRTYQDDEFKAGISNSGDQASISWDNKYFFAHENSFWRMDPLSGLEQIGPERLGEMEDAADRMTAGCGDRHFLWTAGYGTDGKARIWKFGSLRPIISPESGEPEMQRLDIWHQVLHLGTTKITSMATYWVSGQPYILAGDNAGIVRTWKLPKGVSPLEPNSGSQFCTTGAGILPTDYGDDDSRAIVSEQVTVLARNLATGISVAIDTKLPTTASWTSQATITSPGDVAFATVHSGLGMDLRFTLATNDATKTPILDGLTVHYQQATRSTRYTYEATVVADDVVWNYAKKSPLTAKAWQAQLDVAAALASCTLDSDIDGNSDVVAVKSVAQVALARDWKRGQRRALSVVVASLS